MRFSAPELGGTALTALRVRSACSSFEARLEALADSGPAGWRLPRAPRLRGARAPRRRDAARQPAHRARASSAALASAGRCRPAHRWRSASGGRARCSRPPGRGHQRTRARGALPRQARASLYLDRMVAPMLAPSDAELRLLYRNEQDAVSRRTVRDDRAQRSGAGTWRRACKQRSLLSTRTRERGSKSTCSSGETRVRRFSATWREACQRAVRVGS